MLEMGCGDGRLTLGIARDARSVLAFDPDAEAIERARRTLSDNLADRVAYRVATGTEIEVEPHSFDLVVFSLVALMRRAGGRRERPGSDGRSGQARRGCTRPAGDRPNPIVETDGCVVCEIDGEPLFRTADAATAAVEALVRTGR